ncbi:aspartate--tRNA ligase [Patescibacteria group bacterium]|nr:aspartate--tRNA ligase [Patescibacteria group bacterium]MCG2702478.1 OB-fold nucleic acid binding domain-containing protein [Candidatus Parcubacteria bacterium]MBU4209831.1 aspartate--tRNA ligase [Patescibacteria group bacterium]MBU4264603.1 aspartate--tRNA ligase [Patescibacteria group bacterium]MBU4390008.1 aspartate--tRNA ligase [Patescibacteria group bacterium]
MKTNILSFKNFVGKKVEAIGWIAHFRKHSKVGFIDLYDRTSHIQIVLDGDLLKNDYNLEDLVSIKGVIKKRSTQTVNSEQDLGNIELMATKITTLSKCSDLPFNINRSTLTIRESLRLRYRYLDLRTERMRKNIITRAKIAKSLRSFFDKKGFLEIETPALTKGTPEGAREYLVPSRLHPGKGYVLPQSPQQFKQLLMVAGIEKYYQLARCFRDEDSRKDRQPEFTQFDIETSFFNQKEIIALTESAVSSMVRDVFPFLRLPRGKFPVYTYDYVMKKYNSDKPDIRKNQNDPTELAFCWVVDFPMFEIDPTRHKISAVHHPFTRPLINNIKDLDKPEKDLLKIKASAYDLVLNGHEVAGGSLRISDIKLQHKVFEILGLQEKEIKTRFGHMLKAFKFSPPPHGGIALGFDRLVAILCGESSIREVIAFPKTGEARDLLMNAPSKMTSKALKILNLKKTK